MASKEIIYTLTEHERKILLYFQQKKIDRLSFDDILKATELDQAEISRALLWLENKKIVRRIPKTEEKYILSKKGETYASRPLPESILLEALKKSKKIELSKLAKIGLSKEEIGGAIGILTKLGLAKISKENNKKYIVLTKKGEGFDILPTEKAIRDIIRRTGIPKEEFSKDIKILLSRGLVRKEQITSWDIELTDFGKQLLDEGIPEIEFIEQLTPEIISSGIWKEKIIRWYDVEAWTPKIWGGRKHPLKFLMEKIKRIFLDMGFREMKSYWVDTEFWCFDSMWIPQDHPAREMQSTFWLENPHKGTIKDDDLANLVKEIQENGGDTGSSGWRLPWSKEIAQRCILRTHTTATTFRVLGYGIRRKKIKPPIKFFAVGRVFRNETIDWKHLAEFHQIEGFVIAPNLTLRSLMGYIKEFYSRIGIKKIRFKPTYNPYTEPSMEIFAWHSKTGRWVEVGNSGMFRPESLAPYGVDWPTVAWGLALERLAMLIWNIEDIRKVLGPSVDLDWVRTYKFPVLEF
ncbi:MAG: phenylalanine--tRNA ligase subunit alpha [Candidatus Njordarchaeota archaeon]